MPKGVVCQSIQHCALTIFVSLSFLFCFVCTTYIRCVCIAHTHKSGSFTIKYFGSMNVFKILKVVHYELCIWIKNYIFLVMLRVVCTNRRYTLPCSGQWPIFFRHYSIRWKIFILIKHRKICNSQKNCILRRVLYVARWTEI